MGVHKITSNGESITVPDDLVLIRTSFFKDLTKAFEWYLRELEKRDLNPRDFDDHGLIFIRADLRDQVYYNKDRAKRLHTSKIWYSVENYGELESDAV